MEQGNDALEKICGIRSSFEELAKKHSDDANFTESVAAALGAARIPSEEEIRQEYGKCASNVGQLRIGIVGAVKSGRSSFLEQFFLDGQSILPRGATPMTAALTEMTFGEECTVTVDFFTDQDIAELKAKSDEYERLFNEIKFRKASDLEKYLLQFKYGLDKRRDRLRAGLNVGMFGRPLGSARNEWESRLVLCNTRCFAFMTVYKGTLRAP